MRLKVLSAMLAGVVLSGCAGMITEEDRSRDLVTDEARDAEQAQPRRSSTYVRMHEPEKPDEEAERISFNEGGVELREVLSEVFPEAGVRPVDPAVSLSRKVDIFAYEMTLDEFLQYLTAVADYEFVKRKGRIEISSTATRQFNLGTLASNRTVAANIGGSIGGGSRSGTGDSSGGDVIGGDSGGSGGSSSDDDSEMRAMMESEQDSWDELLATARAILGVGDDAATPEELAGQFEDMGEGDFMDSTGDSILGAFDRQDQQDYQVRQAQAAQPWVSGQRSLGEIHASGSPARMAALESYFDSLKEAAERQVHLDIKTWDVSLEGAEGSGIDWSALTNLSLDGRPFEIEGGMESAVDLENVDGGFTIGASLAEPSGAFDMADLVADFLGNYGEVRLLNQPNITTLNGSTAFLSSGEEFSFTAEVETVAAEGGQVIQTPQLEYIRIGVNLAVTARVLDDERIAIDIVPVVSSLQGFNEAGGAAEGAEGVELRAPDLAMQELSTQVIARSGEPVHLGGLISERVESAVSGAPMGRTEDSRNPLRFFFSSEREELERRELVMSVTATHVD